jgi:hypothetical protein
MQSITISTSISRTLKANHLVTPPLQEILAMHANEETYAKKKKHLLAR